MQRKFFVRSMSSLMLAFVCAIFILLQPSIAQATVKTQQPEFPITVNALQASNLRELPTTEAGRIGGVVGGAVLEIVGCNDTCEWYQLDTGEWIAAFLVSEISTVEAADGRPVANGNANLRSGPSTNYLVAGGVLGGQVLDIIAVSEDGSWYKLSSGQWIADFLVDNPPEDLPVGAADEPEPEPGAETSSAGAGASAGASAGANAGADAGASADAGVDAGADIEVSVDLYDDEDYAEVVICSCEADYYDCDSFYSQPQAQACYNYCLGEAGDIHEIDPDGNALACEELPEYADVDPTPAATDEDASSDADIADVADDGDVETQEEATEEEAVEAVEAVEAEEEEAAPAEEVAEESETEPATEEAVEVEEEEAAPAEEVAEESEAEPATEEAVEVEEEEAAPAEEPVPSTPAPAAQAAVATTSIPVGFTVQEDEMRGYSLALPRGWTPLDLRSQQFQNMLANFGMADMVDDLTAFLDSESGQAIGMVAVTDLTATFFGGLPTLLNVSVIEVPNATPEWSVELVDALIKANTEALGDVQILDLAPDVINNLPAVRASVVVGLEQMGIQSELFAKVVGLITPERIYVLTLATTPDRTAEREPVFDQIISSFGPN